MTYKVNDLVYFDGDGYKGVGKVVSINGRWRLVYSTQITGGHDGNGFVEEQDNKNNLWFSEDDLKPFTKKVGQKYKFLRDSSLNFRAGDIAILHHIDDDGISRYKKDSVENYMFDIDHENCEVEFYADVEDAKEQKGE